jgi:hypothetical protein
MRSVKNLLAKAGHRLRPNTYQAPLGQERGDPPNRAAEQRGEREVVGSSSV